MDQQQMQAPVGQQLNLEVIKEPRGFMKILQFIFSMCAFATVTGFETYIALTTSCDGETTKYKQLIVYPFDMGGKKITLCGDEDRTLKFYGGVSSDARFFVATGVLSFLYAIAAGAFYVLMDRMYQNNVLAPVGDFLATLVLALFWFAGSCAWANGLGTLKHITDPDILIDDNKPACENTVCDPQFGGNFAGLNITVILGFLNFILWGSNLWFLYKETSWFKGQAPPAGMVQQTPQQTYPPFPQQA